jgi:hypothetical protein
MKPPLFVTGASHGIGKAVAAKFAAEDTRSCSSTDKGCFIELHSGSSGSACLVTVRKKREHVCRIKNNVLGTTSKGRCDHVQWR